MMTLTIQNVGQDATGHTYRVEVYVNYRRIDTLIVKGHDRADGWPRLLEQIAMTKRINTAVEQSLAMAEWAKEEAG